MTRTPVKPRNPERICWGCDKYCPADSLACGNGTIRTLHPVELFGEDWLEWSERRRFPAAEKQPASAAGRARTAAVHEAAGADLI